MKKITLIVLCVLAYPLFGQESNGSNFLSKNELSIVVDDIFAKNTNYYSPIIYQSSSYIDYNLDELNTPKIGLSYKYHFAKSAIRSKVSFGLKNNTDEDENEGSIYDYSLLTSSIYLGYELHKNMNKTQIFYGVDLFINYRKLNSESTYTNDTITSTYERIGDYMGFGISPVIGVKYFLSPSISISTELNYSIESYKGEKTYKYSGSATDNTTETSGIDTKFGPLGQLSINIHF